MQERFFNLHGNALVIAADDSHALKRLEKFLAGFAVARNSTSETRLVLHAEAPQALLERKLHLERQGTPRMKYEALRMFRLDQQSLYSDGASFLLYDRTQNTFEGVVAPATLQSESFFENTFFGFALWEWLSRRGLFLLHGAVLKTPQGEGVVLAGNSRQGKTTLSVALARSGFDFLTDDLSFIDDTGRLRPFLRDLHVDPVLARHFPELDFLKNTPPYFALNPKRALSRAHLEKLYSSQGCKLVENVTAPAYVLFPKIRPVSNSRLSPLTKGQALAEIIAPSVLIFLADEDTPKHLTCLQNLIEGARCFDLVLGQDVFHDPSKISDLIQNLTQNRSEEPRHAAISL